MKTFKDFNGSLSVKRGDSVLTLNECKQAKGTKGVYPGLTPSSFDMGVYIEWLGGDDKFTAWLCGAFNTDSQLLWKDASESLNLEKDSKVSPETMTALIEKYKEYLLAMFDGRRTRERDASSIALEMVKVKRELAKLIAAKDDKDNSKISDLRTQYTVLATEYKEASAREQEAILMDLEVVETKKAA